MSTITRRTAIVETVTALGEASVPDLAERFGVSSVTIRSDLRALDKLGFLIRARGGAIADGTLPRELSIAEKSLERVELKMRLARAAVELIDDGDSLILDSGSTTEALAGLLDRFERLTVLTNGLNIAERLLAAEGVEVLVTGGRLRRKSESFYGPHAERAFDEYHFDKLILGVDGIGRTAGLTTHFEFEAALNRRMCEAARTVIAVADSSKFAQTGVYRICDLGRLDVLVTDRGIPAEMLDTLRELRVDVVIADRADA